jgi:hypothetical protein
MAYSLSKLVGSFSFRGNMIILAFHFGILEYWTEEEDRLQRRFERIHGIRVEKKRSSAENG